jgi:hypothetical protein
MPPYFPGKLFNKRIMAECSINNRYFRFGVAWAFISIGSTVMIIHLLVEVVD